MQANTQTYDTDVLVVGAGNAAMCAALSARESGLSVMVLERAPLEEGGGNSRFTAGNIRFAFDGDKDIHALVPDLSEEEKANTDFASYPEEKFFDDMFTVTNYRTDPQMVETLVRRSRDTMMWLKNKGIRFVPRYGHQAVKVNGRFKFWGGLALEAVGGGPGLVDSLWKSARERGIDIQYGARATSLLFDGVRVEGVRMRQGNVVRDIRARAVVLACGGFEANPEWRARYLGPGWELAKVRGTRFNTGDGLQMALDIGAASYGHWTGCHAVGWDLNATEFGDLEVGDGFQKHSYPLGIMVNAEGKRFLDEGLDFMNYTYAKYGHEILAQTGQFAWQIFDSKVTSRLRAEYRIKQATRVSANTLEELAGKLEGVDPAKFLATVKEFNAAVMDEVPFDQSIKDGRGTRGLEIAKSNWANAITEAPFEAYAVTCGITFTYGGVRIDKNGQVLNVDLEQIPGLYAAGEMIGGLFYFNYPGGTGLMAGAVFGRLAGESIGRALAP
jgi:tricarballylate dehydrogenase